MAKSKKIESKKQASSKTTPGHAKDRTKQKRSNSRSRGQKVWYITRFRQRYELPDHVRFDHKNPLPYTKDFVGSGKDDESCSYFRQIMSLRTRPNWLELRGAFAELKNISANASRAYRGYLLNSNFQPASDEQIGSWLGLGIKESKKLLKQLGQAGLIEQVTIPDFEQSKEAKTRKAAKKRTTKKSGRKAKVTGKKKAITKNSVTSRRTTRKNESARDALNKKTKAKAKVKVKTKDKLKTTSGLTAPGCKRNNNDNGNNGLQGKINEQVPCPPTTLPLPSVPQESDEGGRGNNVTRPPDSVEISRQGLTYGRRVYLAMGYPYDIDSTEAAREIGSFGSKHDTICRRLSALSPSAVDTVLLRGLREASKIAKRPTNKNKGAVWNTVIDKLADAMQRKPP